MDLGGDPRVQSCPHSVVDFDSTTEEYYCVMCGFVVDKTSEEATEAMDDEYIDQD